MKTIGAALWKTLICINYDNLVCQNNENIIFCQNHNDCRINKNNDNKGFVLIVIIICQSIHDKHSRAGIVLRIMVSTSTSAWSLNSILKPIALQ